MKLPGWSAGELRRNFITRLQRFRIITFGFLGRCPRLLHFAPLALQNNRSNGTSRPRCYSLSMPKSFPEWIQPMASMLTQEHFNSSECIFERKFDGIRLLGYKKGSRVELFDERYVWD